MTSLFDTFRAEMHRRLSGDRHRVLVAEDSADLAGVIAMLLGHCGFDVRTALDGRVVLAMARAFRPHFILLDIRMPGLDGYAVAEMLRKDAALKEAVIIGISAYRAVPQPGIPHGSHFDHYLMKPFEFETLLSLLKFS